MSNPPSEPSLFQVLSERLAAHFPRMLAPELCLGLARSVVAKKAAWIPAFEAIQFSLGRAYYTHLEEDRAQEYFEHAAESDALVEATLPGFQEYILARTEVLLSATVERRSGWCGPGVHVFPSGQWVSQQGGEIHFDVEGLLDEQIAARARALSLVFMLQPPIQGGGIRVWDALYSGSLHPTQEQIERPSVLIPYDAGDLVVFDSYRLHQIQPFSGDRDRISATAHVVEEEPGRWSMWF